MLTEYEWLNYGSCTRDEVLPYEVIAYNGPTPLMRGAVLLEKTNVLFLSFAITKHITSKSLMRVVNNFKSQYGHFKWAANINKRNYICLNFAERFGFCEKSDIILVDEELIYVEREPSWQTQYQQQ